MHLICLLLLGFGEILFVEMLGTSWLLVISTLALGWGILLQDKVSFVFYSWRAIYHHVL